MRVYNNVCSIPHLFAHLSEDLAITAVTAEDIAEEIVWTASRPPHVNIAELFVLPVNQASPTRKPEIAYAKITR